MQWDWSRIVELTGLVVTILSLHMSNVRFAQKTRDDLTKTLTEIAVKVDLMHWWFKRNVIKGKNTESDDQN
jgi:hypothetical protein